MVEREVQVHLGRREHVADSCFFRSRSHLRDRALEHLEVHLESDCGDRTVLLSTEKVARTPDLEVAESDLEPLPQLVESGNYVQVVVGALRERTPRAVQEVRVCPPARTS